jgi:Glycosyl transferase family 11
MASITAFLCGGLGNQLFQYAVGKSLSLKNNVSLILDLSGFEIDDYYKRTLELSHFNIGSGIEWSNALWKYKGCLAVRRVARPLPLIANGVRSFLKVELSPEFDNLVVEKEISNSVLMLGYWQDERYFSDIRTTLQREFTLKEALSSANTEIANQIARSPTSVAVHLRRLHGVAAGTIDTAQALAQRVEYGITLPLNYYHAGAQIIEQQLIEPHYFVFSDDPQWAKDHLRLNGNVTFLENGRGPDREDIALMSQCKHHLIANSSFSWWGAWLAHNPAQVVIAPKAAKYTPNIPDHWNKI